MGNTLSPPFELMWNSLTPKNHNYNHNKESISKSNLEIYKACCCDERCESVESPLTSITSILSRTPIPAHALWKPRKSSLFYLVLHQGISIHTRPSTKIPQLPQSFSIRQKLRDSLMRWKCTSSGKRKYFISCDRPVGMQKKERGKSR